MFMLTSEAVEILRRPGSLMFEETEQSCSPISRYHVLSLYCPVASVSHHRPFFGSLAVQASNTLGNVETSLVGGNSKHFRINVRMSDFLH